MNQWHGENWICLKILVVPISHHLCLQTALKMPCRMHKPLILLKNVVEESSVFITRLTSYRIMGDKSINPAEERKKKTVELLLFMALNKGKIKRERERLGAEDLPVRRNNGSLTVL
jgi:hypothetical protein